jgi:hypothetical protein
MTASRPICRASHDLFRYEKLAARQFGILMQLSIQQGARTAQIVLAAVMPMLWLK